MDAAAIKRKIRRMHAGEKLRVLDLFSGCGGLSLGFSAAGFHIAGAVEQDEAAARSHGLNFHGGDEKHCTAHDITKVSPTDLTSYLELGEAGDAFDVLVGGPPCQAFARVGRSKLREVAEHPEAFRHDPRARLYIEYLHYVDTCSPLAVVMENVPDMLNHGGHNIAAEIAEILAAKGYTVRYTLLNAAYYGVPQMRERMFLIAVRSEIADDIELPEPTNWIELPPGYAGSRAVALKFAVAYSDPALNSGYLAPPPATRDMAPAVTAYQAIGDLPSLDARAMLDSGSLTRGARRFNIPLPHICKGRLSNYAASMRRWAGFEGSSSLSDHVIRYLPRDYRIFAGLKPGDQYPQAHQYALSLFGAEVSRRRALGAPLRTGSAAWETLKAEYVPPYDVRKFPNKWRKMERDSPARTLLAHLGKDGYSHIHYDSSQARTISVREAARLQSFPDGFEFAGTMNPAFRQIGNAVPPLLARAVANALRRQLTGAVLEADELPLFSAAGAR